jgi:hypothetical protein
LQPSILVILVRPVIFTPIANTSTVLLLLQPTAANFVLANAVNLILPLGTSSEYSGLPSSVPSGGYSSILGQAIFPLLAQL